MAVFNNDFGVPGLTDSPPGFRDSLEGDDLTSLPPDFMLNQDLNVPSPVQGGDYL
jgi:hypothetical protein